MPTFCSYDIGLRLVAISDSSGVVYSPPYNFEALSSSWIVNKIIPTVDCDSMDCFMSSDGTKNEENVAALVRTGRCPASADPCCLPTPAGQTRATTRVTVCWLLPTGAQMLRSRHGHHELVLVK